MSENKEPTVKVTPDFKKGDTVVHLGEGTEHKVSKVHPDGTLRLSGLVGRIVPTAVRPK